MGAVRVMADQLPLPPPLPPAARQLLDQASRALAEAAASADARQRYATAHLGALRAAAAVLAARTRPRVPLDVVGAAGCTRPRSNTRSIDVGLPPHPGPSPPGAVGRGRWWGGGTVGSLS